LLHETVEPSAATERVGANERPRRIVTRSEPTASTCRAWSPAPRSVSRRRRRRTDTGTPPATISSAAEDPCAVELGAGAQSIDLAANLSGRRGSNGCAKASAAFASTPCTSPFSISYSSIWLARTRGSARDAVLPPQHAAHASLGCESRGSAQACAMAGSPVCQTGVAVCTSGAALSRRRAPLTSNAILPRTVGCTPEEPLGVPGGVNPRASRLRVNS